MSPSHFSLIFWIYVERGVSVYMSYFFIVSESPHSLWMGRSNIFQRIFYSKDSVLFMAGSGESMLPCFLTRILWITWQSVTNMHFHTWKFFLLAILVLEIHIHISHTNHFHDLLEQSHFTYSIAKGKVFPLHALKAFGAWKYSSTCI